MTPSKGDLLIGSPLAYAYASRAIARYWLGRPGWRDDLRHGVAMARSADPLSYAATVGLSYFGGIPNGVLRPDDSAVREIEDALRIAERSGDDLAVVNARVALGMALAHRETDAQRYRGLEILAEVGDVFVRRGHNMAELPIVNVYLARERARRGDRDERHTADARRRRPSVPRGTAAVVGRLPRRVFWWRRCWIAAPKVMWSKPRPRSSG